MKFYFSSLVLQYLQAECLGDKIFILSDKCRSIAESNETKRRVGEEKQREKL